MNELIDRLGAKLKIDTRYVFNSGGWLMIGYIATFLTVLATSYVFANFIDPDIYGQYKYLLSVGIMISAFSLTGISTAVVQAAAKDVRGFYRFALVKSFQYGLITTAIALIGSAYYFFTGNNLLAIGLFVIAFLQPLLNSLNLVFSYFNGAQQFKVSTKMNIFKTMLVGITLITTTFYIGDILVILSAYFISHVVSNVLINYFAKLDFSVTESTAETNKLFNYAKHTSARNMMQGFANQLDKVIIFQNMGAVELATYTFATALPDQYKTITKSVESLLLPRFSQQSQKSVRQSMLRKSVIYFLFLVACATLYTLIAPYIFAVLFPLYEESVFLSQIYVWGIIFGIGGIPLSGLKSEMKNGALYYFSLITSLFWIACVLILTTLFGLTGAVISRVLYRMVVCISAYTIYLKTSK
jgi:O-antigen/teichoic acid export membrane protein